jgi:hypothetical protein
MDLTGYLILILAWIVPVCAIALFYPTIKRFLYRAIHKNYIVCHMYAQVGGQYMEVRTNIIPVGVRSFKNDINHYVVDPHRIVWRPTGFLGGNEMNLNYIVGRMSPISFDKIEEDKSAQIGRDVMDEKILHNYLTSQMPKTYLYIIIGLIVVIVIFGAILGYFLITSGGTAVVTPPR